MTIYDVVIIGAGTMGSSTSYYTTRNGLKVLLIEQFEFGHTKGSSHGESRIIRKTYVQDYFSNMMSKAYELWEELENLTNQQLILKTGGLDFGPKDSKNYLETKQTALKMNIEIEILTAKEIAKRFPIDLPDNYEGIYQKDAGILNPDRITSLLRDLAKKNGCELHSNEKFLNYTQNDDLVKVTTDKGTYSTKKLIITIGSWIKSFLEKELKIKFSTIDIWQLTFGYYTVSNKYLKEYSPQNFPIFICWENSPFYGFPLAEKKDKVKIAPHFTNKIIDDIDEKKDIPSQYLIDLTDTFVKKHFRGIESNSLENQTCLYTMAFNENFLIDFLPNNKNILLGGTFSGHGFKFTPLIGYVLSEMALENELDIDLSHFNIKQFMENH